MKILQFFSSEKAFEGSFMKLHRIIFDSNRVIHGMVICVGPTMHVNLKDRVPICLQYL